MLRRWTAVATLGVAAVVAGLALLAGARDASAANASVTVADFSFTDAASGTLTTTITAGDSVTWTWAGGLHSVTADNGSFDDPVGSSKSSGTFSHTFTTPGTYAYYCRIHGAPGGIGMHGIVVVNAAAPTATASATATSAPSTATATAAAATRTPTNTPAASATASPPPSVTVTAPAPSATPSAAVTSAPTPSAGAAGAGALPPTGSGGAGGSGTTTRWLAALLIAGGAVAAGASLRLRRRGRTR